MSSISMFSALTGPARAALAPLTKSAHLTHVDDDTTAMGGPALRYLMRTGPHTPGLCALYVAPDTTGTYAVMVVPLTRTDDGTGYGKYVHAANTPPLLPRLDGLTADEVADTVTALFERGPAEAYIERIA